MTLSIEQKNRLGQCLARLVPGFDGHVLAYKNHEIIWNDQRPIPSEHEIILEYEKIILEETKKTQAINKQLQANEKLKNIDIDLDVNTIDDVKALLKDLISLLKTDNDSTQTAKPSQAVESILTIDGVRIG